MADPANPFNIPGLPGYDPQAPTVVPAVPGITPPAPVLPPAPAPSSPPKSDSSAMLAPAIVGFVLGAVAVYLLRG